MNDIWSILSVHFFQLAIDCFNQGSFLSKILSPILISEFFILFLSCISLRKRFSNRAQTIYPLSEHSLPLIFFRNLSCSNGFRSSTFPNANMRLRILTLIVDYQRQFKSKEPAHGRFSTLSKPSKYLINKDDYGIHSREWNR